MRENLKRQDYHEYAWQKKELVLALAQTVVIVIFLSLFFYRNLWMSLLLSPIGVLYFRILTDRKRERCKEDLVVQFKECILSVAASLKAGYAIENAFLESRSDMELLYGKESVIYRELEGIRRGLIINITLEEQLFDLADRSDCEEIVRFARVFSVAKRNGGNLTEIIGDTAELIGRKIDVRLEMQTVLSGRRMEQTIMRLMPFGVLGYIGFAYPGYFDVLYQNLQGAAIMTGCLAIYLAAYFLGERILHGITLEMA